MLGPLIIIVVLLVIPVFVILTCSVIAGLLGWFLKQDVDDEFEGTEYLELG